MRHFWHGLRLGLKSLLLHKLRSGLTILGIVFGVAAVISMLAVGEGASRDAQKRFEQLGATNIIVRSIKPTQASSTPSGGAFRAILNYGLQYNDLDRIIATVPTIHKALPIREIYKQIRRLHRTLEGRVVGTTHEYLAFNRLEIERGRFLSDSDNERFENFAVLGSEAARTLFPFEDPLGRTIKLGVDYYSVVGQTKERASSAGIGGSLAAQDFNRDVYIPIKTCKLRFGERLMNSRTGSMEFEEVQLSQVTLQVKSLAEVAPTHSIVEAAVRPYHPKNDVDIIVPLDLLNEAKRTARQFSIILGTIASISLLVGGIGIMNIMLATVTERTREIGIRRALGAKRRDITRQFLIETVVLSALGGLIGVSLGIAIPRGIVYFIPEQKAVVTSGSIALAFGISVGIGVLFGLYPARRAALMDPIDALRHE